MFYPPPGENSLCTPENVGRNNKYSQVFFLEPSSFTHSLTRPEAYYFLFCPKINNTAYNVINYIFNSVC